MFGFLAMLRMPTRWCSQGYSAVTQAVTMITIRHEMLHRGTGQEAYQEYHAFRGAAQRDNKAVVVSNRMTQEESCHGRLLSVSYCQGECLGTPSEIGAEADA